MSVYTTHSPALTRLHRAIRDLAHPFAGWLADAVDGAFGGRDTADRARLVAAAEAEGARLIGALPCALRHGIEIPESLALHDPDSPFLPILLGPCGGCGAEL